MDGSRSPAARICRRIRYRQRRLWRPRAEHDHQRQHSSVSISAPPRRVPGVLAILTPDNAMRLAQTASRAGSSRSKPFRCSRTTQIYYNGQHIAVVVADTSGARPIRRLAGQGAAIRRPRPRSAWRRRSGRPTAPKHFRNGTRPPDSRRGDPEAAFAAAPVRLDLTYTTPVEHHNPMEPHATIALWEGDRSPSTTRRKGSTPRKIP